MPRGQPETRACSSRCGFSIGLDELKALMPREGLAELAQDQLVMSERLFYGGVAFVVLCSLWAAWSGNWLTLFGGVLVGIPIFALSLKARYRAWQIDNERLFETRPPFGNFINAMIRPREKAPSTGKELKEK